MKKIWFILLILLLTGCSNKNISSNKETVKLETISSEVINEMVISNQIEKEPEIYNVSIMAVGDNLYHSPIYKKGYIDNTYNFDFVYENITDFINSYDIAIVNQETVLVDDYSKISSYPCFGTPIECGDALINAGFDVFLGATNHSYDKKEYGVLSTVNYFRQHPQVTYLGLHDSIEDYETIRIIEKNNISIAMLNYTYGLNGFVIPDEKYYLVDTLYDKEKIKNDLQYAENNADITIVFPHWGNEYVYNETDYQIEWAEFFTENGADIIIGAHPHVVEPVKTIVSENGNSSICYYSLGNFVSNQNEKPRILGGIASLNITKTIDNNDIDISINSDFIPCVTHYNSKDHTIYLLKDYTDELSNISKMNASLEYLWNLWLDINDNSTLNYNKPPL